MLAAEKLFGEFGIGAVSLRAICAAAGQRNISSVQYHFGDRNGLLRAILEYREEQFEPIRKAILEEAKAQGHLGNVRTLLRVIFEPYARLFTEHGNIGYIKLISSYLSHIRPQGSVPHPADDADHSCPALSEAQDLLRTKLAFLDRRRFDQRSETVAAMFYGAFIQFSARTPKRPSDKHLLFEDTLEMMAAAIAAPPYPDDAQ